VARQPSLRASVEGAAVAGDGDGVGGELEALVAVGGGDLEHGVAGLDGAAGLADDEHEGARERGDPAEGVVDADGVGVVEGEQPGAEGVGEQLRAEGGPADAGEQEVAERLAVGRGDRATRTSVANWWICCQLSVIAAAMAGSGARAGSRSQ
jgi:hypothetical protein